MIKFRVRLAGLIPRNEDWIEFYNKNQIFVTLCRNCIALKDIRRYLESSKNSERSSSLEFAKIIKEGEGKPKKLYKDIITNDIKGKFRSIMLKWILTARSNLLHLSLKNNCAEPLDAPKQQEPQEEFSSEFG